MKSNLPSIHAYPDSLQQKIKSKLDALIAVEADIPPVTIVINLRDATVLYMSTRGLKILGVTLNEILEMGQEYHTRFFNPEDAADYVPKILALLERNNDEEIVSCFQQVRHAGSSDWAWYLSCTKIFMRDENGSPLLTITTATPVDAQHHIANKAQRLLDENNFLRSHYPIFNALTKREREILKMMAKGMSSEEMATELHISAMTASTHRRNIKTKLGAKNNYDITRFAQAFDLI
jgi:DNA-binding CsgD family transcriptional regulator